MMRSPSCSGRSGRGTRPRTVAWRPLERETIRHIQHAQFICTYRVYNRIIQCNLYRQPIEQSRYENRERVRVDVGEFTGLLALEYERDNLLPPALVKFPAHIGDIAVPRGLSPEVKPE